MHHLDHPQRPDYLVGAGVYPGRQSTEERAEIIIAVKNRSDEYDIKHNVGLTMSSAIAEMSYLVYESQM